MRANRIQAPTDLRKDLQSDDTPLKKQTIPPRKPFTNGLFRPLNDQQIDMLEREYYTDKNMVGRDKLFFILKRKYGQEMRVSFNNNMKCVGGGVVGAGMVAGERVRRAEVRLRARCLLARTVLRP